MQSSEDPELQPRRDLHRATRTSSSTRCSPNNGKARWASWPSARRSCTGSTGQHLITDSGGPSVNPPLTHILPSGINWSAGRARLTTRTRTTSPRRSSCIAPGRATRTGVTLKFLYRNASEGSSKTFATVQQDLKPLGIDGGQGAGAERRLLHEVPAGAQRGDARRSGTCHWRAGEPTGTATVPCRSSTRCTAASRPSRRMGSNFGFYSRRRRPTSLISQGPLGDHRGPGRPAVAQGGPAGDEPTRRSSRSPSRTAAELPREARCTTRSTSPRCRTSTRPTSGSTRRPAVIPPGPRVATGRLAATNGD